MMFPPRAFTASLLSRQTAADNDSFIYCSPECPGCKSEVTSFNIATSCLPNSTFIVDCGACQQCILAVALENDTTTNSSLNLSPILSQCLNTSSSMQIEQLEGQASRISALATAAPTTTPLASPTSHPPIWIAAPIIISLVVLGAVCVRFFIIHRRKHRAASPPSPTELISNNSDFYTEPQVERAQLHGDSMTRELDSKEMEKVEKMEPVELEGEPVGYELSTPVYEEGRGKSPISPFGD